MKPYPIFLIGLENQHCVVVGGTREAEGKVRGLLAVDATVTVIHPTLTEQLAEWAEAGRFTWIKRPYQQGDLRGAFFVVAERSDPDTNAAIYAEGVAEGALVGVMDDLNHCNWVAGSVVRQGPLTISISTSGAAPALAVRLRQQFEQQFGPEYATFLTWMKHLRPAMHETHDQFSERKRRYYEMVDSDILELIRNGRFDLARNRLAELSGIEPLPEGITP